MASIEQISRFPVTGAQAEDMQTAIITAAGIIGDRPFVLYDQSIDPEKDRNRVSQKQYRDLARVSVQSFYGMGADYISVRFPDVPDVELPIPIEEDGLPCTVNEFGTITPAFDCGDAVAGAFADYLKNDNIRLAQKTPAWMMRGYPAAEAGNVAPLHIVTVESVEELQRRAPEASFGAERLRANILLQTGEEPFAENDWVGETIYLGDTPVFIARATKRCPVPGFDQKTGENRKDIPKLYPGLTKVDNKPVIGVYGIPLIDEGEIGLIHHSSEVTI